MPIDEGADDEGEIDSAGEYSDTENIHGVEMSKARPIGTIFSIIGIPVSILFGIDFISNPTFASGILAFLTVMGTATMLQFRVSEKTAMEFDEKITTEFEEGKKEAYSESSGGDSNTSTKNICRECHSEVSADVKRCPNCGWKPKKRGGLWWGTTAVMSLNPIGWAMGAKGASDKIKASKGVSKEIETEETNTSPEDLDTAPEANPTDTLERLNELKEQGAITESEFEEKKEELLGRI